MRPTLLCLFLLAACSPEAEKAEAPAPGVAGTETGRTAAAGEAPVTAGAAEKGEMRSFRAWEAACDNVRTCTLFGFPGPDGQADGGFGFIRIERAGTAEAEPVVTLAGGEWNGEEQSPQGSLRASVDGGRAFTVQTKAGDYGPYHAGELRGAEARSLIAAIRNGRTLTLQVQGFAPNTVSLDGAAAALLWADERQARVSTRTALARPGDRPMTARPPSPPAVRAVRWLGGEVKPPPALLRRPDVAGCLSEQPDSSGAEVIGERLTADLVLWQIPCGSGAYNQNTAFYFADAAGNGWRPVPLAEPQSEADGPANQMINAGLDSEIWRLTAFNKGRGIGDCGSEEAWAWDGARFVLVHQAVMGRCEGVWVDLWPVLHRAEVR